VEASREADHDEWVWFIAQQCADTSRRRL